MKEKKIVLLGLLDVIEAMEPSREDITVLVREMAAKFALVPSECFPPEKVEQPAAPSEGSDVSEREAAAVSQPQELRKGYSKNGKRLGRPPHSQKTEMPTAEDSKSREELVSSAPEQTVKTKKSVSGGQSEPAAVPQLPKPRKGFSKSGVRLGRPPKNSSRAVLVPSVLPKASGDEEKSGSVDQAETLGEKKTEPSENVVSQQSAPRKGYSKNGKRLGRPPRKNTPAAETSGPDTDKHDAVSIEAEHPVKAEDIVQTNKAAVKEEPVSFEEEVEQLKYGREYTLDALYLYKGKMVRTNRVMSDARPLGVFIPHLRRCGYTEFLLYYTDESAGLTVSMAESYARNKLPEYQGQHWKIKEPWYDSAVKEVLEEANILLKKMGGDKFEGKYFNPRETYYGCNADVNRKFRYVCDVP